MNEHFEKLLSVEDGAGPCFGVAVGLILWATRKSRTDEAQRQTLDQRRRAYTLHRR